MRSHYCGHVDRTLIGQNVVVAGWVHRRRDHGGVIFVDLRDREGLVQVVFDPDDAEMFADAERLRPEFVLSVEGRVRERPEGTINPTMPTGEIEIEVTELVARIQRTFFALPERIAGKNDGVRSPVKKPLSARLEITPGKKTIPSIQAHLDPGPFENGSFFLVLFLRREP